MSDKLNKAREYEEKREKLISKELKPIFHLVPRVGWMNDPNGFSYYDGKFHMFYQYYPYDTVWGPMHWGHAVSTDLLNWENLPAAMAPDEKYDDFGCFSGSAIELSDGKQLLMYTGVIREEDEDGILHDVQTQCIAVGDGKDYVKYENNPVLDESFLPEGASRNDFRDPKIWREKDGFKAVVASKTLDADGQLLLFSSKDGYSWKYEHILAKNNHRFGRMWECPDFFELDGKNVLLTSPQDMLPEELEFHNGNGTLCQIGYLDESGMFKDEYSQAVDYGIDFYAPQTLLLKDSRRVMIGWMQNWDTTGFKRDDFPWFGQMSLPREISIVNGKLIQKPLKEIEKLYTSTVERKNVRIAGNCTLSGISGRTIDMTLDIKRTEELYRKLEIRLADNGRFHSSIFFDPVESVLKIDRKYSGSRRAIVHQRRCQVGKNDGAVRLRIIMDRYSLEVFVNDGEQVMSMSILTDYRADGISFNVDGEAVLDVCLNTISEEK